MERRFRLRHFRRIGLFVAGLVCILAGLALAVLPGPLTIPPVLLGLYLWSLEFEFAARFFDRMKEKGDAAWEQAKCKPVISALVTGGGLVAAGAVMWAVVTYDLVDKAKDAVGF
jgi:drug/metabolite transporter (DMT)-like permease